MFKLHLKLCIWRRSGILSQHMAALNTLSRIDEKHTSCRIILDQISPQQIQVNIILYQYSSSIISRFQVSLHYLSLQTNPTCNTL